MQGKDRTDINLLSFAATLISTNCGIRRIARKWFESYMTGRSQKTLWNNILSNSLPLTHGVPQGSILGPILFLVMVADMPKCVHSVCFINNVYKQRFFQLVKIFQNLNNRTSQNLYVKQRMNQMKTRIQFSSGPSSIFRLAVRFQQIIFFRHHKCRMQISVPILTLINTNPSQVSFILLPSIK